MAQYIWEGEQDEQPKQPDAPLDKVSTAAKEWRAAWLRRIAYWGLGTVDLAGRV